MIYAPVGDLLGIVFGFLHEDLELCSSLAGGNRLKMSKCCARCNLFFSLGCFAFLQQRVLFEGLRLCQFFGAVCLLVL